MLPLKKKVFTMIDKLPDVPDNVLVGVLLSIFLAAVRVLYDNKEAKPLRILLEALLCGLLTFTACYGVSAMGWSSEWNVFVGGVIGFIGADAARAAAIRYVKKQTK